ncbi:MAG: HEAT repeat domain-containing protein [Planctomycetes bacterium]|nr:HEAT repeat domain-containing protein [Planctomycetota bacterium]
MPLGLLLLAVACAALAAGCGGSQKDVTTYLNDLFSPPSTAERVVQVESRLADNRREALQKIAKDREARRIESVVKLYCLVARTDADPMVRAAAVRGLADMTGEPVVPALCHVLAADKDAFVRTDAATSLGRHADPPAMEALVDALKGDPNVDVRIAAAESLRAFRDRRAADALAQATEYRDLGVAYNAWLSLRYMTGQNLPREAAPWTDFLASAADPFADYGHAPRLPRGVSQRPRFTSGIGDFFHGLFAKDPLEAELE